MTANCKNLEYLETAKGKNIVGIKMCMKSLLLKNYNWID